MAKNLKRGDGILIGTGSPKNSSQMNTKNIWWVALPHEQFRLILTPPQSLDESSP